MATDNTQRLTIIGTVGLLGASLGLVVGLAEAACLRLGYLPLYFDKPVVAHVFWYFSPLLTSLTFCLLGMVAGLAASMSNNRFVGKLIISVLVGLASAYIALAMRFSLSKVGTRKIAITTINHQPIWATTAAIAKKRITE